MRAFDLTEKTIMAKTRIGSVTFLLGLLVCLSLRLSGQATALPTGGYCTASESLLAGPCFAFHGRMSGPGVDNIQVRIWRIGTHRLLGVPYGACDVPDDLLRLLDQGNDIYADIVAHPLTPLKPGAMQFVCVVSASKMVTRRRSLDVTGH